MGLSIGKLAIIALVIVILFNAKNIPRLMSDLGKGIAHLRREAGDIPKAQ
jgi:TatA/E family protein of Tat protein translocase